MRSILPVFVALAALGAGLAIARARAATGSAPARSRAVAAISVGMATVGVILLGVGWWSWGEAPAGTSPALVASVAYVGASIELFFAAMLAPSALRAVASSNPSVLARRR